MGRTASALRGNILEAALTLFATHGYRGTSLHDIASEVGCSKASLLYHFANKDALLTELLTPAGQGLAELDGRLDGLTGAQAAETAVDGFVDLALRYRRELQLLFSDLPEMLCNPALSGIPDSTEQLLSALAGRSEADEDRVAAWMVIGGVFITAASDVRVPDETLRAQMIRSALLALGRTPGRPTERPTGAGPHTTPR
ncbi:helix-turn-helix domain-containing protein [Streptomyces sp. ODS28]|uniref:TetR/AcrR family transcriptional regulator n=1 Tax=Streptomyces sp. ODS28 TaxID=3136688 RepID=UPI0031F00BBB